MTTSLQLALFAGLLAGSGVAGLIWYFAPARADVADVARRYSMQGVRERDDVDAVTTNAADTAERLGVWAMRRLPTSWWGRTPTRELALLRIATHRHYATKIMFAVVGLTIPPVITWAWTAAGFGLPVYAPAITTIAMGAVMWWLPDHNARADAAAARIEFGRALGAYSDLVALERLGGSGARQSMELAAEIGDSWVFARLSEELARSRWSGVAPWDALHTLSEELGLPELNEFADIMRLSTEGAQVYSQLRARSEGLRSALLSEELGNANAVGTRMTMPMALLTVMFLVMISTPALLRLTGGV